MEARGSFRVYIRRGRLFSLPRRIFSLFSSRRSFNRFTVSNEYTRNLENQSNTDFIDNQSLGSRNKRETVVQFDSVCHFNTC